MSAAQELGGGDRVGTCAMRLSLGADFYLLYKNKIKNETQSIICDTIYVPIHPKQRISQGAHSHTCHA